MITVNSLSEFVVCWFFSKSTFLKNSFRNTYHQWQTVWIQIWPDKRNPDQTWLFFSPDLGPNCLQRLSADNTRRLKSQACNKYMFHFSKKRSIVTRNSNIIPTMDITFKCKLPSTCLSANRAKNVFIKFIYKFMSEKEMRNKRRVSVFGEFPYVSCAIYW